MRIAPAFLVAALVGCSQSGSIAPSDYDVGPLTFQLDEPLYGSFVGDDPGARVRGTVSDPRAVLLVEGQRVPINEDGSFDVWQPFDGPYLNVDVEVSRDDEHFEARVPVFSGFDPLETWPGGVGLRFTDRMLGKLADVLGGAVDGLFGDDLLLDFIPEFEVEGILLEVQGLDRGPVVVDLEPTADGLKLSGGITNIRVRTQAGVMVGSFPITVPVNLVVARIGLDALLVGELDPAEGIVLLLTEPKLEVATPSIQIPIFGFNWLSNLLSGALNLDQLLGDALDSLLDGQELRVPVGDPLSFDTELLGMMLSLRLAELRTDEFGVGLGLNLGLDEPAAPGGLAIPFPLGVFDDPEVSARADLSIGVHEGVLQLLLGSGILDLLEQDISLPGFLGSFLGTTFRNLPGGDQAPENNGWCLNLNPGEARLARFQTGVAPLAEIYLPDATLRVGTLPPGQSSGCEDWLVSSLEMELGVRVREGTKIGFNINAPGGKLISYGADGVDDDAVVQALGASLSTLLGALGGALELDLADLLGGGGGGGIPGLGGGIPGLGGGGGSAPPANGGGGLDGLIPGLDGLDLDLELAILDSTPVIGLDGQPVDGLYEIGLQVLAD